MDVTKIALSASKADELYRKYRTHQVYQTDMDREIARAYKEIARGKVVIQAIESIKRAGLDAKGLPKLALARATASHCFITRNRNGSMEMRDIERPSWRQQKAMVARYPEESFSFPAETFGESVWEGKRYRNSQSAHKAVMPIIPIDLRPKRGIENYHVLWEAEWTPTPPRDPYLLRRIGKADLWLVCAAWDLTDVEMAAMSTRVVGN